LASLTETAADHSAVRLTRRRRVGLVIGGILGAFLLFELVTTVVAYTDDAYVRSDLVAVAPQITGRIIAVHVVDNQTVKLGDPLVTIDPVPFQLVVAQRAAEINEAGAQVVADQDAIVSTQESLASAIAARDFAQVTQERATRLTGTGDMAQQQLDQANDTLQRAEAAVASAQAEIGKARALSDLHQAAKARAEAGMAIAQWELARTQMVAPTDGTINNLTVRVGDTARADVPLIGVVDAHAWRIIANYKQSYLRHFTIGETAWVWLDSQPWRLHRARIASIARGISREQDPAGLLPYVAPTTDWIRLQRRFPVTITLVDPPADLTLFMGADARTIVFH
jgi:membrane fusion protein, multidrug efflux system